MTDLPITGDALVLDVYCPKELLPITGASFAWTLKRRKSDADAQALSTKDSPTGILIKNTTTGWVQVRVPGSETATFPSGVPLHHDIQIKTAAGDPHTIFMDTITFERGVTDRS